MQSTEVSKLIEVLPGRLYLSNGQIVGSGHRIDMTVRGEPVVLHTCVTLTHSNGGEMYCKPAVIQTPRLIPSELATDAAALLLLLDKGVFDLLLVMSYMGKDQRPLMRERLSAKVRSDERAQRRTKLIEELDARYPTIPEELRRRVKNHDFFYDYSDDNRVWRSGMERAAKLTKELEELGCPNYMGEIATILHTT